MNRIIHINQHKIKANAKRQAGGEVEPVVTVKTYKSNDYGHTAIIRDDFGKEVARIVYSPDKPLSCGARVWIQTENEIELVDDSSGVTKTI